MTLTHCVTKNCALILRHKLSSLIVQETARFHVTASRTAWGLRQIFVYVAGVSLQGG